MLYLHGYKKNRVMQLTLNEQEQQRRKSLEELRSLNINPYPAEGYEVNTSTREIL